METSEIQPENFYYIRGSSILEVKKLLRRVYVEKKVISEGDVHNLSIHLQVNAENNFH